MTEAPCPRCAAPVAADPRYPHALCAACTAQARCPHGRIVMLLNASAGGGLLVRHADDGTDCPASTRACADHGPAVVLLDGVEHAARDRRFGGVVVQPWDAAD